MPNGVMFTVAVSAGAGAGTGEGIGAGDGDTGGAGTFEGAWLLDDPHPATTANAIVSAIAYEVGK